MTVELAYQLLRSGSVPTSDVEAALIDSVRDGKSFIVALYQRGPRVAAQVDAVLSRADAPIVGAPRADTALLARLPPGLCRRLLVVPLGRDARGVVDLAVASPADPHVGTELAHHLDAPVRLHRASVGELIAALDSALPAAPEPDEVSEHTPAFGTRALRRPSAPAGRLSLAPADRPRARVSTEPREPDDEPPKSAPIPLVRRSIEPPVAPVRRGTNPGVGRAPRPEVHWVEQHDDAGEPVIGLFRSKPPPPPESASLEIRGTPEELLDAGLRAIAAAVDADGVAHGLIEGASAAASQAIVLAARHGAFEGRHGSAGLNLDRVRGLRIPADLASVLDTAARAGQFLGALPDDAVHAPLRGVFGGREIYATSVTLSGHLAMLLVLAELRGTFDATRRADRLAAAAGERLEAIVRARKRRSGAQED